MGLGFGCFYGDFLMWVWDLLWLCVCALFYVIRVWMHWRRGSGVGKGVVGLGCGGLWWHGPWWCNGSVGVMGYELWVVGFVVWVVARYSVLFRFKSATMVVVGGVTRLLGSGGEWLKGT